jgi:thimet oligopeptidase
MNPSRSKCFLALAVVATVACHSRERAAHVFEPLGFDWHIAPAKLAARCDSAIALGQSSIDKAVRVTDGARTFATSLRPIELAIGSVQNEILWLGQLYLISPDSGTRAASLACSQKATDFGVEVAADSRIYATALAVQHDTETTHEDRELIKLYLETGRRNAAGLDSTTRARVTGLLKRLNDVQRDFGLRLADDTARISISAEDGASLPPQLISTLTKREGRYVVPVNESTYGIFMSHERSSDARRRFYVAYFTRGGMENVRRLEKALAQRDTLAHLLGFDTWAAYQLDNRMAKSPDAVIKFLTAIDEALLPKAQSEIAGLAALKKSEGDTADLHVWDRPYYFERLRVTKYALDEQAVRLYFPVSHVVSAVLDIYQSLLSVRFDENPHPDVWASGVREFRVSDSRSGKWLGAFYLDLFPRPNKYEHFAAFPFHARVSTADGGETKPVCGIIGNWPTPDSASVSLLSHADVVTFFHEFGHIMHCLLGQSRYATTGPFNTRQDFGEAPSQMLENWVWQPEVLKRISRNVQSGQPLPDSLITRITQLRHLDDGRNWTRAAFYGLYDMELHTARHPIDLTSKWAEVSESASLVETIPGTYPEASFGHLMGGYDAGYYGYLWSKVYAQDMFSRFETEGLFNPKVGLAYREQILEPSAMEEPEVMIERFLGRPLSYDAFYRSIGVERSVLPASNH